MPWTCARRISGRGSARACVLTAGNGTSTTYGYDGLSRLTSLAHNLADQPQGLSFTYNAASQINALCSGS